MDVDPVSRSIYPEKPGLARSAAPPLKKRGRSPTCKSYPYYILRRTSMGLPSPGAAAGAPAIYPDTHDIRNPPFR
jgi:hypothetical protein